MTDVLNTTADASGSQSNQFLAPPLTRTETNGYQINVAALAAGDEYSGFRSIVGVADGDNSYGAAGYFEADCTGTQAGEFLYGFGSWMNLNSGTYGAGKYVCAQDNGIYEDASCTITNAKIVYGMRMEAILGDADALVFPFSTNNNNQAITALFDCENVSDFGAASGKSSTSVYIPFCRDANGNFRYLLLYS